MCGGRYSICFLLHTLYIVYIVIYSNGLTLLLVSFLFYSIPFYSILYQVLDYGRKSGVGPPKGLTFRYVIFSMTLASSIIILLVVQLAFILLIFRIVVFEHYNINIISVEKTVP